MGATGSLVTIVLAVSLQPLDVLEDSLLHYSTRLNEAARLIIICFLLSQGILDLSLPEKRLEVMSIHHSKMNRPTNLQY